MSPGANVASPVPPRVTPSVLVVKSAVPLTLVPPTVVAPFSATAPENVCAPVHVGAIDWDRGGAASDRMVLHYGDTVHCGEPDARGWVGVDDRACLGNLRSCRAIGTCPTARPSLPQSLVVGRRAEVVRRLWIGLLIPPPDRAMPERGVAQEGVASRREAGGRREAGREW